VSVIDGEHLDDGSRSGSGPAGGRFPVPVLVAAGAIATVVVVVAAIVLFRPKPAVAVIGDSITYVSAPEIGDALDGDWAPSIDGRPGFTVVDQLPAARALAADRPEQVVINLGTNDVTGTGDLGTALAALAEMVALFPDAECIHVVTVSELMRIDERNAPERAAAFNEGVRALAATDPRLRVIDWTETMQAAQAADPDLVLTDDTVHPSLEGQRLLADTYRDAVEACA
jgi:hypothetical protein